MSDAGPFAVEPVGAVRAVALGRSKVGFQPRAEIGLYALDVGAGEQALGDQLPGVDLGHAGMLADTGIHQGLGEGRLIGLIMAVAPVAEHVDDHGLAEALSEVDGDLGHMHHGFGIVAVHVEDRCIDHLGDVGRVR